MSEALGEAKLVLAPCGGCTVIARSLYPLERHSLPRALGCVAASLRGASREPRGPRGQRQGPSGGGGDDRSRDGDDGSGLASGDSRISGSGSGIWGRGRGSGCGKYGGGGGSIEAGVLPQLLQPSD